MSDLLERSDTSLLSKNITNFLWLDFAGCLFMRRNQAIHSFQVPHKSLFRQIRGAVCGGELFTNPKSNQFKGLQFAFPSPNLIAVEGWWETWREFKIVDYIFQLSISKSSISLKCFSLLVIKVILGSIVNLGIEYNFDFCLWCKRGHLH